MRPFTSETARQVGRVTSARKAKAARRNGKRGGRPQRIGPAHQFKIREQVANAEPRAQLPSLEGCTVRAITRDQARPIILRYEWLGTMGRAAACYGLHSPTGELGVGRRAGRVRDYFRRPDGKIVSERALRHAGVKMADVPGWGRVSTPPKHKYVWFEGQQAAELRSLCRYPFKPYPRRRPESVLGAIPSRLERCHNRPGRDL